MATVQNTPKTWTFRPAGKIAGLSRVTLEEDAVFRPDGSPFRREGCYRTAGEMKATVWGKKIPLSLAVTLPETSGNTLPGPLQSPPQRRVRHSLSPGQKQYIKQLQARMKELKARMPAPADEALERRYWEYLDPHSFIGAFRKAAAVWNNPDNDLPAKCRQASAPLTELYDLLHTIQLPDDLIRDDTQFTVVLARILQFVRVVEEKAEKNGIGLPPQVHELSVFLDNLTDRMIEGGNRLYGIEREMTKEERDIHDDLELAALYPGKPVEERLTLLETLCENPRVDLDEKIGYLEKAIELVLEQGVKKPVKTPCPHEEGIKRHLSAIGRHLDELEEEGREIWQRRIAESLTDAANVWRKKAGLPALTPGKWAPKIRLHSLRLETEEDENGEIRFSLKLRFQDKDGTFGGPVMEAASENHEVKAIAAPG